MLQLGPALALVLNLTTPATQTSRVEIAAIINESALPKWAGERVQIVPTRPKGCPVSSDADSHFRLGKPDGKGFSIDQLAGERGAVVSARRLAVNSFEVVLRMDDGSRLFASDDAGIAFDTELAAARKLIGKSWWSMGRQELGNPETQCSPYGGDLRIVVDNLQRITITGAEFGTHFQKIMLRVKTDDGRDAVLDGWDGYDFVDPAYHIIAEKERAMRLGHYSDRFYEVDPRLAHKDWSAAVWKLIERSEVAVGMTYEAAEMACGNRMVLIGRTVSGNVEGEIYDCGGKRFLIEGERVTKFVDR